MSVANSIPAAAAAALFAGGRASHRRQALFYCRRRKDPLAVVFPFSSVRPSRWPRAIARTTGGSGVVGGETAAVGAGMEVVKRVSCFFIHTSFSHAISNRTLLETITSLGHTFVPRPSRLLLRARPRHTII